ncbi:GTPase HflX [Paenibacillus senegalensis]|uniref:GTPase HflX n=1 Tax=Paenibacillus senegalensis TaxID=1465766 RepID=UPI00028921FF|nr:GTPase HflX [Paenibacillus senegalensis]
MEAMRKAILVGVRIDDEVESFEHSMEELANLAAACDIKGVGQVTQTLERVNPSHYIGKGKAMEVKELAAAEEAEIVLFNDELSPSQIRNLEADLDCMVIDRTMLILDIFAERAKTREAQLQVEIAELQYQLPRLVGLRESLGRQGGGAGLKNRGAGETKLELDRRRIEEKITVLSKQLEELVAQRQVQRKQRHKQALPSAALVGYTNAGKSTLMNAMMEVFEPAKIKQVFEKDMLFATLETSVRSITLPDNKSLLLTDTVGFVSKLPHHLVKAFRSTLEEVAEADLLIHVVDCSNPHYKEMMEITERTLAEIGVKDIPILYAYNKADRLEMSIPKVVEEGVYLSARQRIGIKELTASIRERLYRDYVSCELIIPYQHGEIVSYFNERANVLETVYEEEGTRLVLECRASDRDKYKEYLVN